MMKLGFSIGKLRALSTGKKLLLIVFLVFFCMSGFIAVSGTPGFCNSCHIMEPYYSSWQSSQHSEINCLECHMRPGFAGYVRGKINGMVQAMDCMVGRMGTKPNGTVEDASCLRDGCHSIEELENKELQYKTYKYTHKGHIGTNVDGIAITCGTCHSHFEGEEHFRVNTQACFTCHFLKNAKSEKRLVETKCQSCHNVPSEPVNRDLVEITHTDLVSYEANCEESCHKKQLEQDSNIHDSICLNCHNFRKSEDVDSQEMHELHANGEKVECFACHGVTNHKTKASMGITIFAMLDCQTCHSNTHEVQRSIYTARQDIQHERDGQLLSPMFMTHVECKGCHIKKIKVEPGVLDSLGMVAKAVPQACDHCHESGTGDKYIPFWQDQTKRLYEKVKLRIDRLQERATMEPDKDLAKKMTENAKKARLLLEAVRLDGSWGVHNFKYTETILINAKEIVRNTE